MLPNLCQFLLHATDFAHLEVFYSLFQVIGSTFLLCHHLGTLDYVANVIIICKLVADYWM